MSCRPGSPPAAYELQHSSPPAAYELQHSNSTAAFRAAAQQQHSSLQSFRAAAQQQHSSLQSCSTAAFRAAAQQPSELQHSSLQSCSTAAFRRSQNGAGHTRSASKSRAGGFASTLQPLQLQALRPPALKIDRPSKPNSTPCLETRPVAITEWKLTTPSLERDSKDATFRCQPCLDQK